MFVVFPCVSDHPFHNFEHATHVTRSVVKLLQRVAVTPDVVHVSATRNASPCNTVLSDPLTQFAAAFAALVHDVDHPGVGNRQLVAEADPIAITYCDGSSAEQNSICIAWNLLMGSSSYRELRSCLFASDQDLKRFRQVLVNAVLSTDIFDPDLQAFRDARWDKAFSPTRRTDGGTKDAAANDEALNLRATALLELMVQCSDVAHTMRSWQVYQKWNRRLFCEMHAAYMNGDRRSASPADTWYEGELAFLDSYVIPLATRWKECCKVLLGAPSSFPSCDDEEFLERATANRNEWKIKGLAIVAELVHEVESEPSCVGRPSSGPDAPDAAGRGPSPPEAAVGEAGDSRPRLLQHPNQSHNRSD
jgi:3'5'-cyclic nucleotide phosphodiesterase